MPRTLPVLLLVAVSLASFSCAHLGTSSVADNHGPPPLTVVAIGDAGENGSAARANASLLSNMYIGQHDGGRYDAMVFLGNDFSPTGLNVPADEVEGVVKDALGPYKIPIEGLGKERIHGLPGNNDYYSHNAIEASVFFGLINIAEIPIGLSGRGNERAAALDQWTYHHGMPAGVVLPLSAGAVDSVQFLFVDSALPLRTDTAAWGPALDSLRRLLDTSRDRAAYRWRILCMHHPLYSLGEHGGYTVWDDVSNSVEYLTPCDRDSNAVGWVKNLFDPEDLCADKYRRFIESVKRVIRESGVRIQLSLTAHDHSLQLLSYPDRDTDCPGCPKIHIVSGAGSAPSMVRMPAPPAEYTSAPLSPSKNGVSGPGFVQLTFTPDRIRAVFFDAYTIAPVDMGGGRREFEITQEGVLEGWNGGEMQ
jgi:hypothetical protein